MIFFFNSKGDVINALPETIKQGSNKANRIWFFMPTSPSNVVNAYFRLPNGEYAEPQIMTLAKEIPEVKIDAQNFSCWFCDIKKSITLYAGTLLVNFRITNDDEEVATESISVPIVSGVVPPLELEKSYTYAELMAYISILQDKLSNVLTEEEKAKVDKLVIDGDGDKFLADNGEYKEIESGTDIEANPTEEATENLLKLKVGDKTYLIPVGEGSSLNIQIAGTSIVENGVANIPYASQTVYGVVRGNTANGVGVGVNGLLYVENAYGSEIREKKTSRKPIVPSLLDEAVKVGVTTNTKVLTDDEKASAQAWLGITGGTQLYKHHIVGQVGENTRYIVDIMSPRSTEYDFGTLVEDINNYPGFTRMYYQEYIYQENIGGDDWRTTGIYFMFEEQMMYGVNTSNGVLQLGYIMEFTTMEESAPIPLQGE